MVYDDIAVLSAAKSRRKSIISDQRVRTDEAPVYGDQVATIEPFSIEHIPAAERHGRTAHLFWLWFGANLTIADYALGFLPVAVLGVPLGTTIVMLFVGNLLGAAVLGACAAMGMPGGYPQMFMGRRSFGRVGGYLPAGLNWASTAGWFTVNTILGGSAVRTLWPSVPFWLAAAALVAAQTVIVVYGHNLIHRFEQVMSAALGVLFAIATIVAVSHWSTISAYRGTTFGHSFAAAAIVLAASFSYIMSWSPYASDYSRYLPEGSSLGKAALFTFAGSGIASLWLEVVGALVAILAIGRGLDTSDTIGALDRVMGGFGGVAVVAVIFGACAANALNLYSNTMSARVLDLRVPRVALALAGAVLGFVLALAGHTNFLHNYTNFLLFLDYWITPWLAIVLLDFYVLRQQRPEGFANALAVNHQGLVSYLIGVAASVPFMGGELYHGPLLAKLHGVDVSYFVGFLVAGVLYLAVTRRERAIRV